MAGERFDEMYAEGAPPWDIGRPQPAVAELIDRGWLRGPLLDVGCGTGENALYAAARGLEVVGVDASPRAIAQARAKAKARGLAVRFAVHDAFGLDALRKRFEGAIDSGLFHTFSDDERPGYVQSLAAALLPGAHLCLLCFSEREPDWGGPRRVTQEEIHAAFGPPFVVELIEPARFANRESEEGAHAWRALIARSNP
jgi:cyclopropane fatty-acyl-phospholipid synthase-like methyltransferase